MEQPFVSLRFLKKSYEGNTIFQHVTFDMIKGEIISMVGPSGTGKSTLLRCLAGLEEFTEGEVWIDGEEMTNKRAHERPIVMMFQQPLLFPHMTVIENIMYGLTFTKLKKKDQIKTAKMYLNKIGLEDYEKFYPHELSGGQQQRVALARALATNPKLLLLDEPFSSLDNELREEIRSWVKNLLKEQKITAIFVTHDKEEAMMMGDRIIVMGEQKIQQFGKPLDVYYHPMNPFVAKFFSDGLIIQNQFFIHSENIVVSSKRDEAWYQCWQGNVKGFYVKYGKMFYQIRIADLQSEVTVHCEEYLTPAQPVWIGVRRKGDIQTFAKG
jgi:ABC-type Fe3+/spermidine/putrescine transport system ATPase subunit